MIDPVIVAALGNGNHIVRVTEAQVDALGAEVGVDQLCDTLSTGGQISISRCRAWPIFDFDVELLECGASSPTVSITSTVSFPFPSAATIRSNDHDHGYGVGDHLGFG